MSKLLFIPSTDPFLLTNLKFLMWIPISTHFIYLNPIYCFKPFTVPFPIFSTFYPT